MLVETHSGFDIEGGGDKGDVIYAIFLLLLEGDFKEVLQGMIKTRLNFVWKVICDL